MVKNSIEARRRKEYLEAIKSQIDTNKRNANIKKMNEQNYHLNNLKQ